MDVVSAKTGELREWLEELSFSPGARAEMDQIVAHIKREIQLSAPSYETNTDFRLGLQYLAHTLFNYRNARLAGQGEVSAEADPEYFYLIAVLAWCTNPRGWLIEEALS